MGRLARIIGVGAGAASVVVALSGAQAFAQTPTLRVTHAAALVVVQAENRADIAVSVSRGAPRLPPLNVRRDGRAIVVDEGLDAHALVCSGGYSATHLFAGIDHVQDTRRVKVPGLGWVNVGELPVVTVHAPRAIAIAADGAVWGEVGVSDTLRLENVGCGDWRVEAVGGKLDLRVVGSGDIKADTAGALDLGIVGSGDVGLRSVAGPATIVVAGSGDVHVGAIGGALDVQLRGSGDLTADRVEGPVNAKIAGSSDVKINGGHASALAVQTSGSGDFLFNGVAGSVSAAVSGSGDIRVAHADGPVAKSVSGSGDIDIGR